MFDLEQGNTMKTVLLTLALLTSTIIVRAQNDNPLGGTGSVTSQREFKREIRTPNGNGVEGTEFFTLNYECTWELVSTNETKWRAKPECVLRCNGKKHANHADCDTSCDTPCPVHTHRFSFTGFTHYLTANMRQAEHDASTLVIDAGGDPYAANWTSYVTKSLSNAKRMSERLKTYAVPCWNNDPCSSNRRYYGLRKYQFHITGRLMENGYLMSHGVKTAYAPRNRGMHGQIVAEVWLPETDPLDQSTTYNCKCKLDIKDGLPNLGKINSDGWVPPVWGGVLIWDSAGNSVDGEGVRLNISGVDLNRVHVEVQNDLDRDVTVLLGGGLVLVASDDKYQSMTIVVQTKLAVPAHSTQSTDARAACVAMNKLEPDKSTAFSISPEQNPALLEMAAITNASHFRGPADQARVWIVTDHATFDDIKKHLVPGPGAAQYLNALYDVSRADGIDVNDKEFQDCFDADLLLTTAAKTDAVAWFVQHLDRTNPGALLDFAKKHSGDVADELGKDADQDDVKSVSELIQILCACSSIEGRQAGLELLLHSVPEDKRDDLVKAGALEGILVSMQSDDPREQEQTLDVIDVYSHKPSAESVAKLAELGASDKVKSRAKVVAEKLGSGS